MLLNTIVTKTDLTNNGQINKIDKKIRLICYCTLKIFTFT